MSFFFFSLYLFTPTFFLLSHQLDQLQNSGHCLEIRGVKGNPTQWSSSLLWCSWFWWSGCIIPVTWFDGDHCFWHHFIFFFFFGSYKLWYFFNINKNWTQIVFISFFVSFIFGLNNSNCGYFHLNFLSFGSQLIFQTNNFQNSHINGNVNACAQKFQSYKMKFSQYVKNTRHTINTKEKKTCQKIIYSWILCTRTHANKCLL